jgi:hypothetical protein
MTTTNKIDKLLKDILDTTLIDSADFRISRSNFTEDALYCFYFWYKGLRSEFVVVGREFKAARDKKVFEAIILEKVAELKITADTSGNNR